MSQKKKYKKKTLRPPVQKKEGEKSATGRNPDGTFAQGNAFAEKYQDRYADLLVAFFSKPISHVEYTRTYYKDGQLKSETPVEFVNDFPTMGMFARSIGVSVSALKAWAGITEDGRYKHDRFASAYARVKEWAGGMMESGALSGKLDTGMAKFVLTNDYNMNDKHEVTYTVSLPAEIDEECN